MFEKGNILKLLALYIYILIFIFIYLSWECLKVGGTPNFENVVYFSRTLGFGDPCCPAFNFKFGSSVQLSCIAVAFG